MPRRRPDRARPPAERPAKTCARCGLPFQWRRKWARDWESVRWCSERCRRGTDAPPTGRRSPAA
ncbi:DUF2256 domain-containing protein [Roseisolibacter sp. H3M3-2]|uniref:DUF2256 domain-containing protein n=1 Tax=Roseisolibacter sp. H3M3-2 TaxID=3031323 RepID=UPI0031F2D613